MLDANVNNLELMSKEELVEILTKMIKTYSLLRQRRELTQKKDSA